MKIPHPVVWMILTVWSGSAFATAPMPPRALDLHIEVIQNREFSKNQSMPLYGYQHREWQLERSLKVRLRYTGDFDPTVTLQWAFIAKDSWGRLTAWDTGQRSVVIEKPESMEIAQSKPAVGGLTVYNGGSSNTGLKPVGYVVRIMQGDRVLKVRESLKGTIKLLDEAMSIPASGRTPMTKTDFDRLRQR